MRRLGLSFFVVLVFGLFCYHVAGALGIGNLFGLEYHGQDVSIWTFLSIACTTLVGAVIGSIYSYLDKDADDHVPWWKSVASAVQSRRFGMSLFATPLIVFIVFDQLPAVQFDIALGLFCLQSGFFWNRTIDLLGERASKGMALGAGARTP